MWVVKNVHKVTLILFVHVCVCKCVHIIASKAKRPAQFSGKITVKAKEKTYSKLEIPYQAEVLAG